MGISLLLVRRTAIPIIILLAWIQLNIMFDHQQFMRLVRFHEEEEDALLQDHKGEVRKRVYRCSRLLSNCHSLDKDSGGGGESGGRKGSEHR